MGKRVDPWWSVRWYWHGRMRGFKLGPWECFAYRFGRLDYSVTQGKVTAGWHVYSEFVGTRTAVWMDGDCF